MTPENLETFMGVVVKGLTDLEDSVSRIASFVINELETIKLQVHNIFLWTGSGTEIIHLCVRVYDA